MRKRTLTPEEQKKYSKEIAQKKKAEEEEHKLLNKKFRKSLFYISSLTIRFIFITLFFIVLFCHEITGSAREEIVTAKDFANNLSVGKYGRTNKTKMLYLETDRGEYNIDVKGQFIPPFETNDTLLIERNILGKPIYFTKSGWPLKYSIPLNFLYYCIVLVFTFFSLFLNDGPGKFIYGILILAMMLNIIAISGYFLS